MNSKKQSTHSALVRKTSFMTPVYHLFFMVFLISLACINRSEAATVYQNTFDDPGSLGDFTVYGEEFVSYNPPPLHSVSIDAGQLRIDTDYLRPNGPNSNPTLYGRAFLSVDTSSAFNPVYSTTLSQNDGIISWSFNVSNQDGGYNNFFSCVLASTMADPLDINADGYSFNGGGMSGDRMVIKRFDAGLGGGGEMLIDIAEGLGPLPDKGSFRITFNPVNSEWSLYGETGPRYTDPTQVDNLLGTAIDDTYTGVETKYFGLSGKTTGTDYFDNVKVDVVPEPSSIIFVTSTFFGAGFLRRRMS
jgi:hypothetical protein